jgi:hypothetical protein
MKIRGPAPFIALLSDAEGNGEDSQSTFPSSWLRTWCAAQGLRDGVFKQLASTHFWQISYETDTTPRS